MENSKKRKGYSQSLSLPIASLSIVRQRSCGGTRSVYICTHLIDIMVDDATDTPDTRRHGPGVHFRCTHPYHRHTTICTIFPQFRVQRGSARGFKAARQFPLSICITALFFYKKRGRGQLLDPLSHSLLASATAPSATSKHKTIELHNPSQVVELKFSGTLTFKWKFKWEE